MKKKPLFWVLIGLAVILLAAVTLWGRQYYNDRYVGSDYYAMVPLDYDMTPETLYSMDGRDMGLGKEYVLTAYNEQGEARTLEFYVSLDSGNMPQPGTYLRINASKQIVIRWNIIDRNKIPDETLAKIEESLPR